MAELVLSTLGGAALAIVIVSGVLDGLALMVELIQRAIRASLDD